MQKCQQREGTVLIVVIAALVVVLGVSAFAIDYGMATEAKYEMQQATDAAALGAIKKWGEDQNEDMTQETAVFLINQNPVLKQQMQLDEGGLTLGWWDFDNHEFVGSFADRNALQVVLQKNNDSVNGPLNTIFGKILGVDYFKIQTDAVAALDNRITMIKIKESGSALWPFSVDVNIVDANGDGQFDEGAEVSFFPYRNSPGNWGTIDLNGGENSTAQLSEWIAAGYNDPRGFFEAASGEFTDMTSFPMHIYGDPGLSVGVKDEVQSRVDAQDTVYILVHDSVAEGGNNCNYREISIVPVKLTNAKLTGANENRYIKGVITKSVSSDVYTGDGGVVNNLVYRPVLVK